MRYDEFIEGKARREEFYGFDPPEPHPMLFGFQREVVQWAVKKGRAALFQDCGMGKTLQQIEWGRMVANHTGGNVLILAPLAVASQTVREGLKIGANITRCKTGDDVRPGLNVTNYDRLHLFSPDQFAGIVLDESSILKSFSGKMRQDIQNFGHQIHYRLCCTATPAPNDIMEIGTHAEFLGYMRRVEMLSEYFVHDGGDTQKWRIKRHAEGDFWSWMASWCVAMRKPSDLGFEDDAFILPALTIHHEVVESPPPEGYLFQIAASTLNERRQARRASMSARVDAAAEIANKHDGPVLVWCDLNDESSQLSRAIPDSVEVSGCHSSEYKEDAMAGFSDGKIRVMVSKPSIAGFGMNWAHCNRMVFVGLSDSYEQMYQAVRRCWRFGQTKPVDATIITGEGESAVVANIKRKEAQASEMFDSLVAHISRYGLNRKGIKRKRYVADQSIILPSWMRR